MRAGDELIARRWDGAKLGIARCLGCRVELVGNDPNTGFPRRYCEHCKGRQRTEAAREVANGGGESAAKRSERLKKEGLDNLDRLGRGEPIEPVKP